MSPWRSTDLDLPAYLTKLGLSAPPEPTLAGLRALHRAHVTTIPFENLEIILGRPVLLDVSSVQDKLVGQRRGGYCFEHATLFAAVLDQLGFRFTALSGRVILGGDPESRPATHGLIVVEFDDGSRYLCDVGFGRGPLEPIPLADGTEVDQDGWAFRLTQSPLDDIFATPQWTLHQRGAEWITRHAFTLNPQFPIDFAVGSHFVSTSPRSPFTARTFVQRFAEGAHHTLDALTWTKQSPDGTEIIREVAPAEVPGLLADAFGIDLTSDDRAIIVASYPPTQP